MLRFSIRPGLAFPILHYFDNRRLPQQEEIIKDICLSRLKKKGRQMRRQRGMNWLIYEVITPAFQEIQFAPKPPQDELGRRIYTLGELSRSNYKAWIDVAFDWVQANKLSELHDPDSDLYRLSGAERSLLNRKRRRWRTTKKGRRNQTSYTREGEEMGWGKDEQATFDARLAEIFAMKAASSAGASSLFRLARCWPASARENGKRKSCGCGPRSRTLNGTN
jgi:hypothetical protein